MYTIGRIRIANAEQRRPYAAGHRRISIDQFVCCAVVQHLRLFLQKSQALAHGGELRSAHQCTHAHTLAARVAYCHVGQLRADRFAGPLVQGLGHEDPADRGAFLTGLDRHLAHHLLGQ